MHQFELQAETSIFFVVFAAAIVLTRPVIGWIFDRKGADYTVYPGFLIYLLGMFLFSRITTLTELFIASVFLGLGFGALSPAFQTLAVRSVCPEKSRRCHCNVLLVSGYFRWFGRRSLRDRCKACRL